MYTILYTVVVLLLTYVAHHECTITYKCDQTSPCGCSPVSPIVAKIHGGEPSVAQSWHWIVSLRQLDSDKVKTKYTQKVIFNLCTYRFFDAVLLIKNRCVPLEYDFLNAYQKACTRDNIVFSIFLIGRMIFCVQQLFWRQAISLRLLIAYKIKRVCCRVSLSVLDLIVCRILVYKVARYVKSLFIMDITT